MAMFAGVKMISTGFMGKILQKVDKVDICFYGAVMDMIYLVGFGTLDWFEDTTYICAMSLTLSGIGGFGNGINMAATIAIESSYTERRLEFIRYNQLVYGLGCIAGPLAGSFLYPMGGYQCPLFTLGGLYLIIICILWPKSLKERDVEVEKGDYKNLRTSNSDLIIS